MLCYCGGTIPVEYAAAPGLATLSAAGAMSGTLPQQARRNRYKILINNGKKYKRKERPEEKPAGEDKYE